MDIGKRILIIDFTDYEDYPIGGYLTFAKNLMESFGADLALAGITTNYSDPVGKWFQKNISGTVYDFFAMGRYNKDKTRHLVPDRLVNYLLSRYYCNRILRINISNIFLQRQELMIAIAGRSENICYCFAGLENPLSISKYPLARNFSSLFERIFFKKLKYTRTLLARGDDNSISEMIKRSRGQLSEGSVIKFPTRINTKIFRPLNRNEVREKIGISISSTVVVTTGRLAQFKGWEFMIYCFRLFEQKVPNSIFCYIGEGEDFNRIKTYISNHNLTDRVFLKGRKSQDEVALYLNAADLFIMGSYKEGWSTSLIEAIACGIPACVTDFSSAKEIIEEGKNGFVVDTHNADLFVQSMLKALKISRGVKNDSIIKFSSDSLKDELLKYWELS